MRCANTTLNPWTDAGWSGATMGEIGVMLYHRAVMAEQGPGSQGDKKMIVKDTPSKGRRSGERDLLPLPLPNWSGEDHRTCTEDWHEHCWLWSVVRVLNQGFNHRLLDANAPPTPAQEVALRELRSTVRYFLGLPRLEKGENNWTTFYASKSITYSGEINWHIFVGLVPGSVAWGLFLRSSPPWPLLWG